MTPSSPALHHRFVEAADHRREGDTQTQPQRLGRFYIHDAMPMKGAQPAADGRCFFLLQTFPIPEEATPGQVRDLHFDPRDAVYQVYYGHISHARGESGLSVGYVDTCYGTQALQFAGADDLRGPTITQTTGTLFPRPQVSRDTSAPRYGDHEHLIQTFGETIATLNAIDAARYPKPEKPRPRGIVIGGYTPPRA